MRLFLLLFGVLCGMVVQTLVDVDLDDYNSGRLGHGVQARGLNGASMR
jgi:hypothetical protein